MTPEQIESQIRRIMWGRVCFTVNDTLERPKTFLIRLLTSVEQAEADMLRDQYLHSNLSKGMFGQDELLECMKNVGTWSDADDNAIKGFRKDAKRERNDANTIYRYEVHNRRRAESRAKKLELAANRIEGRRIGMLMNSADYMADVQRMFWTLQRTTHTMENNSYWPTIQDIQLERDRILVMRLMNKYNEALLSQADIREIARSAHWRFRWNSSKSDVTGLFGVSFRDLDMNQDMLVYWSQVYDSAYEAMERPSELVIQNDESFDQWLKDQARQSREKDTFGNRNDKKPKRSRKPGLHREEVFIMARSKEAAAEIQGMNSEEVRNAQQAEAEKVIRSGGMLTEANLRFKKGK